MFENKDYQFVCFVGTVYSARQVVNELGIQECSVGQDERGVFLSLPQSFLKKEKIRSGEWVARKKSDGSIGHHQEDAITNPSSDLYLSEIADLRQTGIYGALLPTLH